MSDPDFAAQRVNLEMALRYAVDQLSTLEGSLRADIIGCCDDRLDFCDSYGCATLRNIADQLQAIRRTARAAYRPDDPDLNQQAGTLEETA